MLRIRRCRAWILPLLLNIIGIESARILAVFPVPSISHQVVFRPITQELARRGHEVVVVTPNPAFPKGQSPDNLIEINVHDLSYKIWQELWFKVGMGSKNDVLSQADNLIRIFTNLFEQQIQHEDFSKILNDKTLKFDLLLLESCVKPVIAISHVFKAPVILVSSLGSVFDNNHVIGAPNHLYKYPSAMRQKLFNLTMWEKIYDVYKLWRIQSYVERQEKEDNQKYKKYFGSNLPTLAKLSDNVEILLLNLHSVWAGSVPVPPSVIYMGGIHQNPRKELPKDLELYLNRSKHGVIYFSLGTNTKASHLPMETKESLIKAFADLSYDVLWVYDEDELPGKSDNIRISKWVPQSDLLRHPNVKLFITQGGLQSTDEAITAAVPMIGIPMIADQWYNVEQIVHHKIGRAIDMDKITAEELKTNIQAVISDPSFRENIRKLRSIIQDQPQKPLERAIWWIEHLLRHGSAKHLRSPVANMPLSEFLELDLILTVIFVLSALIFLFLVLFNAVWKYFKSRFCNKKYKTT